MLHRLWVVSGASLVVERSKAVICRNLFNDPSDLLWIERFELIRTLGSGGMGVVYETHDPRRGERVALKMLSGRGAGDVYRLKREFRALAELTHPNLVALHELSVADQHAFFTMELVAGEDIVSFIRRGAPDAGAPPDMARLRSTLVQLCEGIRALHVAGKLHRDLKPSNVLVTESGRVVLLDFGLVQDVKEPTGEVGGTPEYMAPEQRQGRACEGSDWYAFGLILQRALSGRFEHARQCRSDEGGSALALLAERLQAEDPAQRPSWQEITALVSGPGPDRARALDATPARASVRFIGRASELAALERAFAQSRAGPALVLLRGESGIGKTTLMRRFLMLEARGALVLNSRCYEREFIPFKALDSAIDELSRHLSAASADQLPQLGAEDRRALLHLFPVLGRVPWFAPGDRSTEGVHPLVRRQRGFDALKRLLAGLAAARPVVLCVDDLQWSDADSGVLLASLLCDRDAPPLLVIASDRTDPGRLNPAIQELYRASGDAPAQLPMVELTLGPLPPAEAAILARSWLTQVGDSSALMSERVAAESRGNPLFVKELARWSAAAVEPGGATPIEAIVGRRAHDLSQDARSMLELITIAGRPLSSEVIAQALELPRDLHKLVLELRQARLVHVVRRADAELLELDHDRIGEALLRRLDAARRHALHARLARALDGDGLNAEASVAQYIAADLPEQAAQRARDAGYLALGALAFSRAAWLFGQALELGSWPAAARAHLYSELALALEHAGRGLEAAAAYRHAAELTDDVLVATKLEARAADHLAHNGRTEEGFALLGSCFQSLGMRWPRSRVGLFFWLATLMIELQVRGPRRKPVSDAALALSRARLFPEAVSAVEGYDLPRTLYNGLLAMREAEALGDPVWSVRARGTRALLRCAEVFAGGPQRGITELEESCGAAEQLGDLEALGELQLQLALSLQIHGDPRQALLWARRSEATLRRRPLPPRALYRVMGLIVNSLHDLGELREAHGRWLEYAHEARHHGDVVTSFWTHAHPLQLMTLFARRDRAGIDAVIERQGQLRARHPDFQLLVWSHVVCRVETELYWGRPALARQLMEQDRAVLSSTGYQFFATLVRLLRARVDLANAEQLPPGVRRSSLLCRAWLNVRALSRPSRGFTRGSAPLLRAGIAQLQGQQAQARRDLALALAVFEDHGCKLAAASARYGLGILHPERACGRAMMAQAVEVMSGEGILYPAAWVAWTLPGFRRVVERAEEQAS